MNTTTTHTNPTHTTLSPIQYQNWSISTKVIEGQLWVRWQHPKESFPRYSYPVSDRGLSETIRHVKFLIDLAVRLETSDPTLGRESPTT